MKKIVTLLLISLLAGTTAIQAQSAKQTATDKTVMVYSEEDEAMIYKNESQANSKEILIETLPGFGFDPVPVEISLNENGSYTFKKHPALVLPEYYTVVISDSVTGKKFDLNSADSYTFDVAKATPDRFVLQMQKMKTNLTAMR